MKIKSIREMRYFPKRLFKRIIFVQIVLFAAILPSVIWFLFRRFDLPLLPVITVASLIGLMITTVHFFMAVLPFGRLLEKAKAIKRGHYRRSWDKEMDLAIDYGEWYEFEVTLNKIYRELKKYKQSNIHREIEIETLASAVSDGVIATDSVKRVQYYNGPMALMLGKEFDREFTSRSLDEVFRAPKLTLAFDEVIETKQPRRLQIQTRPHKNSDTHVFDVVVNPVQNKENNIFYGVIAVFHDITESKRIEEVRVDFVANASHELKTPLTSIKGYVDSLVQDVKNKDYTSVEGKLSVVERNVNRLNNLVIDLLTLSRLDESVQTINEEISTEEITEEVIRELKALSTAKSHVITYQCTAKSVKAQKIMLGQVLINLIENAVKYCDEGSQIEVIWDSIDSGIRLRVKDNGSGISEEHLSRVFERFYRINNGKIKTTIGGTGLGLSIVKNSMLRMGGRVEVDSLPGAGTTFTCIFPKL
jgi:two-component system, OmpR family, phosphate regulon sensor histidine kinase PhoR